MTKLRRWTATYTAQRSTHGRHAQRSTMQPAHGLRATVIRDGRYPRWLYARLPLIGFGRRSSYRSSSQLCSSSPVTTRTRSRVPTLHCDWPISSGADPEWAELIKRLNIVLIPYENADGAALHARLAGVSGAATWKHHPARYNALGHEFGEDYFKPDSPFGEARVRPAIWRRWLPDVLVDNHGVPSHEWVQPFAAFGSPPRFRVSYWIPQALIYGIIRHVDDPDFPEHVEAAIALRDAVSEAFRDTDIGELNREIGASYRRWGQDRVPERFPGVFHDDMLWHIAGAPVDPEGRGFNVRYPRTTVLSWVTEVNDETATGEHLEMVANAHLIANRAMLDTVLAMDADVAESTIGLEDGRTIHQFKRKRPLRIR